MEKTREEFVTFIRQAVDDKKSDAYMELYGFLVNCFTRADSNLEGRIYREKFDDLVEEAAELPRRYGFAPQSDKLYLSGSTKMASRSRWFSEMDTGKTGYITLEEWIDFAVNHITTKVTQLPKDYLGASSNVSREEFVTFIKRTIDKSTPEYRELYYFLLKVFRHGDNNKVGKIGLDDFDKMIEEAAAAPRRFGLAPKSSDLYKTDKARKDARQQEFNVMDVDGCGHITFDAWLAYAHKHITSKVKGL